jgi:hypothetical protein
MTFKLKSLLVWLVVVAAGVSAMLWSSQMQPPLERGPALILPQIASVSSLCDTSFIPKTPTPRVVELGPDVSYEEGTRRMEAAYIKYARDEWNDYNAQVGKLYRLFFRSASDPVYALGGDGLPIGRKGERKQWIERLEILFRTIEASLDQMQIISSPPTNMLSAHARLPLMKLEICETGDM